MIPGHTIARQTLRARRNLGAKGPEFSAARGARGSFKNFWQASIPFVPAFLLFRLTINRMGLRFGEKKPIYLATKNC
jgi:hypothetical protein